MTRKVIILGSGTSTGVPVIGCDCVSCISQDPRDQRLRASIALESRAHGWIVIDTGPDFRAQVLRADIRHLDAVLYTHLHADHSQGADDLRAYGFYRDDPIPCYMHKIYEQEFKQRFAYIFQDTGYQGAKPHIDLKTFEDGIFDMLGEEVETWLLPHGAFYTSGFRFGPFAYVTDFKSFSPAQIQSWRGKLDVMVASGIHFGEHGAHSVIPETIQLFKDLEVKRGYITHISHHVLHKRDQARLPDFVQLCWDGMVIDV